MATTIKSAETFPPGEFIREELDARGWSQGDLARVMGRPLQSINQIINAHKRITPETAMELAAALGTSADLWLNLETRYRLARAGEPDPGIVRRARELAKAG